MRMRVQRAVTRAMVVALAAVMTNSACLDALPPPRPSDVDGGREGGACPEGTKVCAGGCVDKKSPATGCGATSCDPCNVPNGVATCLDDLCAVRNCPSGLGDCNRLVADGCEKALTDVDNCGGCDRRCTPGFVCTRMECRCTDRSCGAGACLNGLCLCGAEECAVGFHCSLEGACVP